MVTIEEIELIKLFIINNYLWLIAAAFVLGVVLKLVGLAARLGVIVLSIFILSKLIF